MSNGVTAFWSDKVGRGAPVLTWFLYQITGAKTVKALDANASKVSFDAFADQATIDSFLGTTNEFLLAAFDSTAMGTAAFGGVIDFKGQVKSLKGMIYGVGAAQAMTSFPASAALTASTLATECAKGANGNVGFRVVITGLDALTSGLIAVGILWEPK